MNFFATAPKGLELLLVEELRALGAESAAEKLAGVEFTGNLAVAYQACLWSRLANRILFPIAQVPAETPEQLYEGVQTINWDEHMAVDSTIHINFVSSKSDITHTLYGAQKVKDAIVDQFRQKYNARPNVSRDKPDLSIHVYLNRNMANISIDLSGESLHKRGIRVDHGAAPLKENLAAAILLRSGWKSISASDGMLIDPMCGSGTLLIEAAQMAGNIAPGLSRDYFGFLGWKQHDAELWDELINEAKSQQFLDEIPVIIGYDSDPRAIKTAFANIERAGMLGKIHVEKRDISECKPKENSEPGLIVMNPPYGERLGEVSELQSLYETIGTQLKNHFMGWHAAVFTGNVELGKTMGIRARRHYSLFNGAIPCQLLLFDVKKEWFIDRSPEATNERRIRRAQRGLDERDIHAIQMFINRLQKNNKHLKRWAQRENITSYRLYDADLPEYAVSVDRYEDFVVVKEYPAPKSIDKTKAERRLHQILAALPEALQIPAKNITLKAMKEKMDTSVMIDHRDLSKNFHIVHESQVKFFINLQHEQIEAGLPLHQRQLRSYIRSIAKDKHCLILFPRSGTMTTAAALGGASSTLCVDDSEFHLSWTKQNLALNNIMSSKHQTVQADPTEWVLKHKNKYDLIIVELPESSHRLRDEYHEFITHVMRLLRNPGGTLLLTSRDKRFKLNIEKTSTIHISDLTHELTPPDFEKQARTNPYWELTITGT